MNEEPLENPVFGYVVMAVALLVSLLSATVFGQVPANLFPATHQVAPPDGSGQDSSKADPGAVDQKDRVSANLNLDRPCSRRWILGVRATSTSTGCVVTAVIRGSSAEKAGLAIGDRVITVNGKQVGWIGRQHAPLHTAIDAVASGNSRLLIQPAKSGSIRSISVKLGTISESLGN